MQRKFALATVLLLILLPGFYLWTLVERYSVEVPAMDDWEMAAVIARAHTHQLTWRDLVKQEEEARMIVPKLIFIASAAQGHWDVRRLMKLSLVFCAATAAGLAVMLRATRLPFVTLAVSAFAIGALIFSPTQFELWLFASGLPSFMMTTYLVAAFLIYQTRLSSAWKFVASIIIALLSSFTLPHGLLAWFLTFPVFLLGDKPPRWRSYGSAWLVATGLCVAFYFWGYERPSHLPEFGFAVRAADYGVFFLAFLGNSFAYANPGGHVELACTCGVVVLFLFLAAALHVIRRRRDIAFVRQTLPWFALGAYAMGAAALATLGRVGLGVDWAVSSRYITFSLYLPVAVIALLALIWADLRDAKAPSHLRLGYALSCFALLGVGAGLLVACVRPSLEFMEAGWARNRLARGALLFSRVLDCSAVLKKLNYPDPRTSLPRALALDDLRLLRPAFVRTGELLRLPHAGHTGTKASGYCDAIIAQDGEMFRASGWATLNAAKRPADCVVLAYETGDGDWRIFGLSDDVVPRSDIARLHGREQLWSGWTAAFPRSAVPGAASISAWGVDAGHGRLYRLQQNVPELKL